MIPVAHTLLLATLILVPFGSVSELLSKSNPYLGFDSDDANPALLWKVRLEKFPNASCTTWKKAFLEDRELAVPFQPGDWKGFAPWDSKSTSQVKDCDDFPCAVKFDSSEVSQMASVKPEQRLAKFETLLEGRVKVYQATGLRMPYEDGDPRDDAWSVFEKRGFKSSVTRPAQPMLFLRKLNLDSSGRVRELRQIVDRRAAENDHEATIWLRDVYTDHYFDSWAEWATVRCEGSDVVLVQGLALELDLLKKSDLLSRLARGSMRKAFNDAGGDFLTRWAQRLKAQ